MIFPRLIKTNQNNLEKTLTINLLSIEFTFELFRLLLVPAILPPPFPPEGITAPIPVDNAAPTPNSVKPIPMAATPKTRPKAPKSPIVVAVAPPPIAPARVSSAADAAD